jgi:hypothetical protein
VTGRLVTEAALQGDEAAVRVLSEVGLRLGEGIGGLVNIIDPQIVVVGGGAILAGDLLLEPARAAFHEAVQAPESGPAFRSSRQLGRRWSVGRGRPGGAGPHAAVSSDAIGLVLPLATSDTGRVLSFARRAEELGFDGLFAFDHLFPPGAGGSSSLEAYSTLAAVAAVTSRVTIGTLVTRAVLRSAGLLAKQAVALEDVSGGRFVLGTERETASARPSTWRSARHPRTGREGAALGEIVQALRAYSAAAVRRPARAPDRWSVAPAPTDRGRAADLDRRSLGDGGAARRQGGGWLNAGG